MHSGELAGGESVALAIGIDVAVAVAVGFIVLVLLSTQVERVSRLPYDYLY